MEQAPARDRRRAPRPATVALLVLLVSWPPLTALGQDGGDKQPPTPVASGDPAEPEPDDGSEPVGSDDRLDPCLSPEDLGESWLDWLNRRTNRTVCDSAMWFDNFFGDDRALEEHSQTGGRVSTHVTWTQRDEFDVQFGFRVRINLPNLDERWYAFVGRGTRDEYLTDTSYRSNPGGPLGINQEQELLIGLGWTPRQNDYDRIAFRLGVTVAWPPEPYAKMIYRHSHYFSEKSQLRWRQTVFWALEDRFGTTTNLDLDRRLSDVLLFRWTNTGTISGVTEGIEWWSTPTLYHTLTSRSALAYAFWINGSTRAPVELEEYGVRIVFRRRIARDWLFLDVGPMVSWPRREVVDVREASWGALIGLEMQFGHRGQF